MSRIDWRHVIVGSMMGVVGLSVVGCTESVSRQTSDRMPMTSADPQARAFKGTIISLRPLKSEMLISKNEKATGSTPGIPNVVTVKWDANTQFYMDNQPTTLDKIEQYMTVSVAGRMREGEMVATEARFSSVLPPNVRRADERVQN